MVLTCLQCQGHSLHLQCPQVCSRTPARFVSVNGACSWSSLHLPFVNVITGFENRHYLLVTDVPYNSSPHERSWCAFLFPSLHSIPWKSFWNSCLWDTAVGLKTGTVRTHSGLNPQGESVREAQSRVPGRCWYRASAPECQGVSVPAVGLYLWAGGIREMEQQIQLFFSSQNLFLLCLSLS